VKPSVVVLFEDDGHRLLWPLAATRPTWELRLGGHTLGEKLKGHFPAAQLAYSGRSEVIAALAEDEGRMPALQDLVIRGDVLWLNGRALADERWLESVARAKGAVRWCTGDRVLAVAHPARMTEAVVKAPTLLTRTDVPAGVGFRDEEIDAPFVDAIWDLLKYNHNELLVEGELAVRAAQAAELAPRNNPALAPGAHVIAGAAVAIHPTARIAPGCVLDASAGPIVVERDAVLEPHTYVAGPGWIGEGTHVLGGKLGGGVALGPVCRVAGEIEETIFQGYGNKRHHGFIGHSVIGQWVNLGALTTTSDLKNNYRPVRVSLEGVEHETNETKVGAFVGDHVKTGIGTLLTTGAVVGPASNLFGGGIVSPRELPAFSWWDGRERLAYDVAKFLETAAVVCARRGRGFAEAQEQLYRTLASGRRP
jgi:UDP-N-acetylglucosamine diphosphorylase/glucosamine-1-phosphate N-acetyltransferase